VRYRFSVYYPQRQKYKHNKGKYVHRDIAERKILFRKLRKNEIVHHIDHDCRNNDPDNLCVMKYQDHINLHKIMDRCIKRCLLTGS